MQNKTELIKIFQDNEATFLCLMDVDSFTEYNLKHTYKKGNKVLLEISEIAEKYLEHQNFVRYSSDEFLFTLFKKDLESSKLFVFIDKINSKLKITVSVGIIQNFEEMDLKQKFILLQNTLLKIKNAGKNKILVI